MRPHSVTTTNEIYSCINNLKIEYHNIEYPELRLYTRNLRSFFASLGDARLDDYWREKKWELRRIAFLLSAAPVEKQFLIKEISKTISSLESDISSCEKLYPIYSNQFADLISNAQSLLKSDLETIKDKVEFIINNFLEGDTAILIKDSKLIPVVEKTIKQKNTHKIAVVSVNLLKEDIYFDNLIIIGPANPRWYPDYVFSSPRARHIHVIKYQWMKGTWKPTNAFPNPLKAKDLPNIKSEEDEVNLVEEVIDPEFILPTMDFQSIIQKAENDFVESDDDDEYVDAVIGYLENEQIVFLDIDEGSSVRIVDINDEKNPVRKILVKDLEPEMFILLRTSGGGDYIIPIANRIMGEAATNARSFQKEWKDRLRRLVRTNGMNWVVKKLKSYGCHVARPINVRNWMSYRSIRTNEFEDFAAIMKLVGLETSTQEIWSQMDLISRAHIRAGFYITKLLLNVVRTANFEDLIKLGVMEFELPDRDAGKITAFRIKHLSSENVPIPISRIGIPIDANF